MNATGVEHIDCSPPGDPVLYIDPMIRSLRDVFGVETIIADASYASLPIVDIDGDGDARVTGAFVGDVLVVLDSGDPEETFMTLALAEWYLITGAARKVVEPLGVALPAEPE